MDIDTTPASHHDNRPSMQLDIAPPDEMMMEVEPDVLSGSNISPQDTQNLSISSGLLPNNALLHPWGQVMSPTKTFECTSPASRSIPNPPAAVINCSDVYSWPKLKLDQLFVEWFARSESQAWLTGILQDLNGGKTAGLRHVNASSRSSRVERSLSPGRSRSPSSSHGNISVSPQQAPSSPVSKLFRTHVPFDDSDSSPRSPPATPVQAGNAPCSKAGFSSYGTLSVELGKSGSLSPTRVDPTPAVVSSSPKCSSHSRLGGTSVSSPGNVPEVTMTGESWLNQGLKDLQQDVTHESEIETEGQSSVASIESAGASDVLSRGAVASDSNHAGAITSTTSSSVSEDNSSVLEHGDANDNGERNGAKAKELESSVTGAPVADLKIEQSEERDSTLEKTNKTETSARCETKVEINGEVAESTSKQNVEGALPLERNQEIMVSGSEGNQNISGVNNRDGRLPPLSPQGLAMSNVSSPKRPNVSKRKALPKFYYPCGRDAELRERKEHEALAEFFKGQRAQRKLSGVNRTDIAELVVAVVGLPSYFATIIFNVISEQFPQRSGEESMRDVDTREENSSSSRVSGMDRGVASRSGEEVWQGSSDAKMLDGDGGIGEMKDVIGSSADCKGKLDKGDEFVSEEQMRAFYNARCAGYSREARLFHTLLGRARRNYLVPSDFKPLMRALLMCHQGLAFLHATPEFQQRYSETVIERIYFGCTRQHNGRLSLGDIKRCKLLDTLMTIDEEEDINRERRYFSYEHFYVLYCRFWELDANHDLQIDKEDLMRYSSHSLTTRIVDRIFSGQARPLDAPQNAGYMSYTDFIWFCLSEEDKTSDTAIDYWFRCVDMDGDGVITMYDMEYFYKEQLHRMESFGHEPVQIKDILCQLLDMISPNMNPPAIRRRDLKKCRLAGNFFNILFNLNKFFTMEARDPLQIRQEHATPELTDWDRFAALEYLRLSADEEGEEDESWEEVGDATNPLMAGEAPF